MGKKLTKDQKQELSDAINSMLGWNIDFTKLKNDDLLFVAEHLTDMSKVAGDRVAVLAKDATANVFNLARERVMNIIGNVQGNLQGGLLGGLAQAPSDKKEIRKKD